MFSIHLDNVFNTENGWNYLLLLVYANDIHNIGDTKQEIRTSLTVLDEAESWPSYKSENC